MDRYLLPDERIVSYLTIYICTRMIAFVHLEQRFQKSNSRLSLRKC